MSTFWLHLGRLSLSACIVAGGASVAAAEISATPLRGDELPPRLRLPGTPVAAARKFTDKNGENYVVWVRTPTRTVHTKSGDGELQACELYAVHAVRKTPTSPFRELRRIRDHVVGCEFSVVSGVVSDSIAVTDLDRDGRAEVTFLYQSYCTNDALGPQPMKLMLTENGKKFAIRGTTQAHMTEDPASPEVPGRMEVGPEWSAAPKVFKAHATAAWTKFATERSRLSP